MITFVAVGAAFTALAGFMVWEWRREDQLFEEARKAHAEVEAIRVRCVETFNESCEAEYLRGWVDGVLGKKYTPTAGGEL